MQVDTEEIRELCVQLRTLEDPRSPRPIHRARER